MAVLLLATTMACGAGCARGDGSQHQEEGAKDTGPVSLSLDQTRMTEALSALWSAPADTTLTPERRTTERLLRSWYASRGNAPRWLTSDSGAANCRVILDRIGAAGAHGLPPELYGHARLATLFAEVMSASEGGGDPDYRRAAELEAGLSRAVTAYARHLRRGLFDYTALDVNCGYPPPRMSDEELLAPLATADIGSWLDGIQPSSPAYRQLQTALAFHEALEAAGGWAPIPAPDSKTRITPGSQHPAITAIARRLLLTSRRRWDAFRKAAQSNAADTTITWTVVNGNVYDATLEPLVREFQHLNGMTEDGIIGRTLVEKLNVTAADRTQQIRVNLDRLRWFSMPEHRHVVVNIPDFRVYTYAGDTLVHSIKICCGKTTLQTPLLIDGIKHVVLNPPWNVPAAIARMETERVAKKDPARLARQGYRVYEDGKSKDPREIDWANRPANKPIAFVQMPGGGNALGKIKFLFPNQYNVYLHDTPTRGPFRNAVRAVSHGCMRVEEPMKLFDFVMAGNQEWTVDKAQAYLKETRATKWINLANPLPVYVVYHSAWVNESGELHLRGDIYGKDKVLKAAMLTMLKRRAG